MMDFSLSRDQLTAVDEAAKMLCVDACIFSDQVSPPTEDEAANESTSLAILVVALAERIYMLGTRHPALATSIYSGAAMALLDTVQRKFAEGKARKDRQRHEGR